jgi:AcrR family transcriptional regulator
VSASVPTTTRHEDPRVTRTKERVLEVVRDLLVSHGPMGVTYSAVAKSAGVGRQTLYNHWASPSEMIRDAATEGYTGGFPTDASSGEDAIRQWLTSLAGALSDPRRAAAVAALIGVAARGAGEEDTLRRMVAARCAAFNGLLAPIGLRCSTDLYARMVGPLHFQALQAGHPITAELIDSIAASLASELVEMATLPE